MNIGSPVRSGRHIRVHIDDKYFWMLAEDAMRRGDGIPSVCREVLEDYALWKYEKLRKEGCNVPDKKQMETSGLKPLMVYLTENLFKEICLVSDIQSRRHGHRISKSAVACAIISEYLRKKERVNNSNECAKVDEGIQPTHGDA